jgi:hypothetical protein
MVWGQDEGWQFWDLLVSMLLPNDIGDVFVLVAFFDESERERVLCIAGFLLESRQAKRLDKSWRKEIAGPFEALTGESFHMKRLEPLRLQFGEKAIKKYERRAVTLVNDHISYATAVLFRLNEAERVLTREWRERFGSVYAACCQLGMTMCGRWAQERGRSDPIAYIFESGHKDQGNADQAIKAIRTHPELRAFCRYHDHAFLDKKLNAPLQAADVWAWLATKHFVERENGLPRSKSMDRLLSGPKGDMYDLRPFVGEENVSRFFRETFGQPWRSQKAKRAYDKRVAHLKRRGEI